MSAASISPSTTEVPNAQAERALLAGTPPHVQLIQMGVAIWQARAVYAAAELGIADLLAAGARSTEDLARATGTHPPSLGRLLRALASCGILTETTRDHFANTHLGDALRDGAMGAARATILTIAGSWQWKAWDNFLNALRTGKSGVEAAFGKSLFEFLADEPVQSRRFNEAMVGMHGSVAPAVVSAYDFSHFRSIVDVGGGKGALLTAILKAHPNLRGVLFDLPETECDAVTYLAGAGLRERCEFRTGNFFESVPEGHDAYVLAHVLHDWDDEQSIRILRQCRRSIRADGRLLIVEAVLPDGDTPHHGKLMDLLMLTVTGGVERGADQFRHLLTSSGFRLAAVVPTATHQSVLEAIPA